MRGKASNRVVYSFQFTENNTKIISKFYKTSDPFCGPDHSASHKLRRAWALSLIIHDPWIWTKLPSHDYITFLSNNGFLYKEFLLVKNSNSIKIFVR